MRIAVLGAGAIGGTIAALLDRRGHEVQVTARGATLAAIIERGLILDGAWGNHTARLTAIPTLTQTPELAFVTTKAQDASAMVTANAPFLRGIPVVVVQNGLTGLDTISALLPDSSVFGALAIYAAQNIEAGRVTITVAGPTMIDRSPEVTEILGGVMPTMRTENFRGAQWSKLIVNMVNGVPAATNLSVQATVANPLLRPVVTRLVQETARIGLAQGVHFEPMQGLTHVTVRAVASLPVGLASTVPRRMARRMGSVPNLGSTLQSIRRGQATEIDYLNGAVAAEAHRLGLFAPANETVTAAVHDVERAGTFLEPEELSRRVTAAVRATKHASPHDAATRITQ